MTSRCALWPERGRIDRMARLPSGSSARTRLQDACFKGLLAAGMLKLVAQPKMLVNFAILVYGAPEAMVLSEGRAYSCLWRTLARFDCLRRIDETPEGAKDVSNILVCLSSCTNAMPFLGAAIVTGLQQLKAQLRLGDRISSTDDVSVIRAV